MPEPSTRARLGDLARTDVIVAGIALLLWWAIGRAVEAGTAWYPRWPVSYTWAGLWLAGVLVLRRIAPRTALVLACTAYPVGYTLAVGHEGMQSDFHVLPLLVAAFAVARAGRLGPVPTVATSVLAALLLDQGILGVQMLVEGSGVPDLSSAALVVALTAGAGVLGAAFHRLDATARSLESSNAALRALQEVRAQQAVRAERTRIARELHDVLAHHVSAIVVRAQAADRVGARDPEAYREAIRWIVPEGKEALGSMRAVVRVLRDTGAAPRAPLPGLDALGPVVDRVRGAGLDVTTTLPSTVDVTSPAIGLAVVRIAQEALTNALTHSLATRADLALRRTGDVLVLEVSDPGPPRRSPDPVDPADRSVPADRGGNGLIHMRERAASCGGTLAAGPTADGRWLVRMEVPLP